MPASDMILDPTLPMPTVRPRPPAPCSNNEAAGCRRTFTEVAAMRELWRKDWTATAIARAGGISRHRVCELLRGRSYAWVPGPVTDAEWAERYGRE